MSEPVAADPAGLDLELPGYEVIELLSRGRRLDVYDAWSEERGCRCVLKSLRPDRADEEQARAELLEEGRLLKRLSHPHLVRAYETVLEPAPAIVLETLSGQTVAHLIEHGPKPSPPEIAHLGLHLGSALGYLHANGVLHLDLKPANVVAEAGRAKVIDLSLAQPAGPAEGGIGTPDYMSPEQVRGGDLGPAADVWGIGLLLHEVATGRAAFAFDEGEGGAGSRAGSWTWTTVDERGPDELTEDDYLQLGERAPLLAGSGEAPDDLAGPIDACLEPDPGDRPTLSELLAALEGPAELPAAERRWSRAPGAG